MAHVDVGGAASEQVDDVVHPTNGQTSFVCTRSPAGDVEFFVNGVLAELGVEYTRSFAVLTWTNASFSIASTDVVILSYVSE